MKRAILKTIFFCFLQLYSFTEYAQNNTIDSLKKMLLIQKEDTAKCAGLIELSDMFSDERDYTTAVQYATEALSLAEKMGFKKGQGEAYITIGYINGRQYSWPDARHNYLIALKILERSGDNPGIANVFLSIAGTYNAEGNYPEAMKNNYKALKLFEESENKQGIAQCYLWIGLHYYMQGENSEALKNLLASLKKQEETGNKTGAAQCYNLIGEIYFRQGNYSEALKNDSAALKSYEQSGQKWGTAVAFASIGKVHEMYGVMASIAGDQITAQKKFSEAKKNFLATLKICEKTGSRMGVGEAYLNLGKVSMKLKNLSEAKQYLEKSLQVADAIRNKETIKESYRNLSMLDSINGNYKRAYERYKLHILFRDSLVNEESTRKAEGFKTQYEFDKKEDEIKLLATENKLKTALAGREGQRKKMAYASIGIILLSGGYGFYHYRRRKKSQSKQTLLNERLRISRELHDEVGATLSGIAMYSHLAKEQIKTNQTTEIEKSLNIMQQSSGEMVNKLNDIVWLINPEQDSLQKLVERLEEYATDMAAIKNMKVRITVPDKITELSLPVESRRNIYLFCKEAINNAVKYSQGSLLELSIKEMDGKLEFSVSDNGKGFDAVMVKRGNGLENMQKRADEIGARLLLQSKMNEGSLVSMQLKIAKEALFD